MGLSVSRCLYNPFVPLLFVLEVMVHALQSLLCLSLDQFCKNGVDDIRYLDSTARELRGQQDNSTDT